METGATWSVHRLQLEPLTNCNRKKCTVPDGGWVVYITRQGSAMYNTNCNWLVVRVAIDVHSELQNPKFTGFHLVVCLHYVFTLLFSTLLHVMFSLKRKFGYTSNKNNSFLVWSLLFCFVLCWQNKHLGPWSLHGGSTSSLNFQIDQFSP
jgi:hypothetical protein